MNHKKKILSIQKFLILKKKKKATWGAFYKMVLSQSREHYFFWKRIDSLHMCHAKVHEIARAPSYQCTFDPVFFTERFIYLCLWEPAWVCLTMKPLGYSFSWPDSQELPLSVFPKALESHPVPHYGPTDHQKFLSTLLSLRTSRWAPLVWKFFILH